VRSKHISQSTWVAELVKERLRERWPESVRRVPGSWKDAPAAEELREGLGADHRRENITERLNRIYSETSSDEFEDISDAGLESLRDLTRHDSW